MNYTARYFIVWVAYNEEKTLEKSFLAAKKSIDYYYKKSNKKSQTNIIICRNGCTDKTREVAQKIKENYENNYININILSSRKGMVIAQNTCVKHIRERMDSANKPIIFIDADSFVDEKMIYLLLGQLNKHSDLKAIGARPVPISYQGRSPLKKFWDKILNCRAYFPKAEIAVVRAPEFHPYAESDPQSLGPEFEKKSKIYFHGRCFALRDQSIWDVPNNQISEDTYLDRSIHYRFGPGSIRNLYDAKIYYQPITSLRVFTKTFFRIYQDLKCLKKVKPQYRQIRVYSKTMLDWRYINTLSLKWRLFFGIYYLTRQFFHFLFKHNLIYAKKSALDIWS